MHEVLVNRLGGLSLPRKSVVRLTDRPDMTLDVYRGRKTAMQQAPAVPRDTAGLCDVCAILIMDIIFLFPRQTCVYMLLSEGLLILGICGQT